MINEIVSEELENMLNEGLGHALGSALKNTIKAGAMAMIDPAGTAGRLWSKGMDAAGGKITLGSDVKNFFGADTARGGNGSSGFGRLGKSKAERQRNKLSDARGISYEYGRPETVPGFGRRTKLARKSEITAPDRCTVDWGDFGNHYHDQGDRAWTRFILDTEASLMRNSNGNQRRQERLQRRYKRVLVDWLKDRDRAYETYIKGQN